MQNEGQRAFYSLLVYENYPTAAPDPEALLQPILRDAIEKVDYPLSLTVHEQGEEVLIQLGYDASLLAQEDAQTLGERLRFLLEQVPERIDQPHTALTLLSPDAQDALLVSENRTDHPFPKTTIPALIERQARESPDHLALAFEDRELTYRELDERSNQLARNLRDHYRQIHGAPMPPECRIALYLDRSLELVLAPLAILKAGGAYVPIDPEFPQERVAFILEDTGAPMVLTLPNRRQALERTLHRQGVESVAIDLRQTPWDQASTEPLEDRPDPRDLAYVIYTSGTTGRPKGVMIEHRSLVNRIHWMQTSYPLQSQDRVLQKTPYSFDVSVWELFWAHTCGAGLVVAPPLAHRDPEALGRLIDQHEITTLHFVPSMFVPFLDHLDSNRDSLPASLRYVFTSGEALDKHSVETFHRLRGDGSALLHNLYGPTETTIDSTAFDCSTPHALVPIGRPIHNTRAYVLDGQMKPAPRKILGELYLGGAGVARGYLNRPELTAERFVPNPFATPAELEKGYTRLYRTGDLVRLLDDGQIEYVGRNDFQVKIRGFRIELAEIENALSSHPDVRQAAVLVHEHQGHKQLVGYYRTDDPVEESALRSHLHEQLPEYMVPGVLMHVDAFQQTLNGKLDRKALPEPQAASTPYIAPTNDLEERLCSIMADVLQLERVGTQDDFFRLGGHSLTAIRLAQRFSKASPRPIQVAEVFAHPTVQRISAHLIEDSADGGQLVHHLTDLEPSLPLLVMIHPGGAGCEVYQPLANGLRGTANVVGIDNVNMLPGPKLDDLTALSLHYLREIRTQGGIDLRPPIQLLGWSMGGPSASCRGDHRPSPRHDADGPGDPTIAGLHLGRRDGCPHRGRSSRPRTPRDVHPESRLRLWRGEEHHPRHSTLHPAHQDEGRPVQGHKTRRSSAE